MEACHEVVTETPAIGTAAPAVSITEGPYVRAAFLGLAFSAAFSSSFILGFYWVGPWLDTVRRML
jgi:hypothetical protein